MKHPHEIKNSGALPEGPVPIGRLPAYSNQTKLILEIGDLHVFHQKLVTAYERALTSTGELRLALDRAKRVEEDVYSALDWFESEVLAAQEKQESPTDVLPYRLRTDDDDTEHA